jgi:uncharacterized membrane protein (DUF4010 family)
MDDFSALQGLAAALALGLLIGLERGWQERDEEEGGRVAGIRTFALIGLLGGVFGLLAAEFGPLLPATGFAALAGLMIVAHAISQRQAVDVGITGVIAALLVFLFGILATLGQVVLATAGAVVTAVLLGLKPVLHGLLERLEHKELFATLKLLLISAVILPMLPNEGMGPWQALNPYRIWWMVVLIAGISYVGYFAMKLIGERKGVLVTGLFAGLASSTAATVNLSRLARRDAAGPDVLAAAVIVACATMFPRLLIISGAVHWPLVPMLAWPLVVMSIASYAAAGWFWYRSGSQPAGGGTRISNPFEIRPALLFAALLAALMMLSRALVDALGDAGVYLLAAVSGLADVDAIALSLANMAGESLPQHVAAAGILIAAFANSLVKAGLALGIAGRPLGLRVGATMGGTVLAGLATWLALVRIA